MYHTRHVFLLYHNHNISQRENFTLSFVCALYFAQVRFAVLSPSRPFPSQITERLIKYEDIRRTLLSQ